jgi:hypothetical protein
VLDVEAADLLQVRGIDRKQVEREFLSENGGATFRDISGRRGANGFVPGLPVLSACFTRTRPPVLVIGTDIGILMTRGPDLGERWSRLGHNLPRVPCSQLSALNDFAPSNPPRLEDGLPPAPTSRGTGKSDRTTRSQIDNLGVAPSEIELGLRRAPRSSIK